MSEEFIVRPKRLERKTDQSVIMTIRVSQEMQDQFEALATKSNYSRNGVITMALQYALDHLRFISDDA